MNLVAYFTNTGVPAIGLSPVISIWGIDGTVYATNSGMTEIAGGFYKFDFTGYDFTEDYVMRAYESSLPVGEQYVIATNENDSQNSQGVMKQILGLTQGNFIMSGQTYDDNGRLLTSEMYTYENASDTNSDINRLHEYSITAAYDDNGNLISYKVVEQ